MYVESTDPHFKTYEKAWFNITSSLSGDEISHLSASDDANLWLGVCQQTQACSTDLIMKLIGRSAGLGEGTKSGHAPFVLAVDQNNIELVGMALTGGIVFRNLRPGEDPAAGLFAKDPSADDEPGNHVRFGTKQWYKGRWISTTTSLNVAAKWRKSGQMTVAIDLDKINYDTEIVDLTDPSVRAAVFPNGGPALNYAAKSQEMLLANERGIPPDAITLIADEGDEGLFK